MNYAFLAIDLQNDFTTEGGKHYTHRPCTDFLKEHVFPFLKEKGIKVNEIVSDYRQPRPGDRDESCISGTWGYGSIVPKEIVKAEWIKCMNSPIWIRENIGNAEKTAGLPYQDTEKFGKWLLNRLLVIGLKLFIGEKLKMSYDLFSPLPCCKGGEGGELFKYEINK